MTQVGRKATEKKRKRKRKRRRKRKRQRKENKIKSGGLNPAHGKNICWVVLYLKRYVM